MDMITTKKDQFKKLSSHAWYSSLFKKLKKSDIEFAESFLEKNASLSKDEYAEACNRLFLGNENKPKNANLIVELLLVCTK
jgi:hypothetical protein